MGISDGLNHSILHDDLGLGKLLARWVPKPLRPNWQNLRNELLMAILIKIDANEGNFFSRIIAGVKILIYIYDPETIQLSKQWILLGSSGPMKFKCEMTQQK